MSKNDARHSFVRQNTPLKSFLIALAVLTVAVAAHAATLTLDTAAAGAGGVNPDVVPLACVFTNLDTTNTANVAVTQYDENGRASTPATVAVPAGHTVAWTRPYGRCHFSFTGIRSNQVRAGMTASGPDYTDLLWLPAF